MPLVTTKKMFEDAYKGGYAIGAFNVNNMEIIQGITQAAKKLNAPLILQVSKGARAYANHTYLVKLVEAAEKETGLPIVTEIMDVRHLDLFEDVDLIQVGARNMQNFDLLKELGKTKKPILLKRGIAATMKELLMSAEYIMASGNEQVILCERGIRTYETYTRNTLDLSAVPMLHELSHLPVVVDPSHATGLARLVTPMALAATAGGADGIMVEVHNDPIHALCDGAQSLTPSQFAELSAKVMKVREAVSQ